MGGSNRSGLRSWAIFSRAVTLAGDPAWASRRPRAGHAASRRRSVPDAHLAPARPGVCLSHQIIPELDKYLLDGQIYYLHFP